jgi:hypothetical protein
MIFTGTLPAAFTTPLMSSAYSRSMPERRKPTFAIRSTSSAPLSISCPVSQALPALVIVPYGIFHAFLDMLFPPGARECIGNNCGLNSARDVQGFRPRRCRTAFQFTHNKAQSCFHLPIGT